MSHKNKNQKGARAGSANKSHSHNDVKTSLPKHQNGTYQNDLMEKVEGGPVSSVEAPTGKPITIQPIKTLR